MTENARKRDSNGNNVFRGLTLASGAGQQQSLARGTGGLLGLARPRGIGLLPLNRASDQQSVPRASLKATGKKSAWVYNSFATCYATLMLCYADVLYYALFSDSGLSF